MQHLRFLLLGRARRRLIFNQVIVRVSIGQDQPLRKLILSHRFLDLQSTLFRRTPCYLFQQRFTLDRKTHLILFPFAMCQILLDIDEVLSHELLLIVPVLKHFFIIKLLNA